MSQYKALASLLLSFGLAPSARGEAQVLETRPRAIEEAEPQVRLVFEGIVVDPRGAPAEGAVVVSSAGGKSVADRSGSYRLEVSVSVDARNVRVTAIGGTGGTLVASTSVDLAAEPSLIRVGPLELASGSSCQPSWLPTFGQEPGTNSNVVALTVFDDGGGPALYAGGSFTTAGGVAANRIAKWDGANWTAVGSGMDRGVDALVVFDDGGGPALYAGGGFLTAGGVPATSIAKWDGTSWTALGTGMAGGASNVSALTVFDDGGGPALYAGGSFTTAGGVAANNVARWDGATWASLGAGVGGVALALEVFDDGTGPALYAGGSFASAGSVAANRIAKWDGANWTSVGSGMGGTSFPYVSALVVFDDGGGPALYAGGRFLTAGGVSANSIAKWDGSSWTGLGGVSGGSSPSIEFLLVFDDGGGLALYAGGFFTSAGGVAANGIAKWDGSSWAALGGGVAQGNGVAALTAFDDGSGPAVYAGGPFGSAGGVATYYIAKWDGSDWSPLGTGIDSTVLTLRAFDDGSGPALHAGGDFTTAGGVAARRIAKWNGSSWAAFGSGLTSFVNALELFDDGSGPALHAGGAFNIAPVGRIARWDASNWATVGSGMNNSVLALEEFDDGMGPRLFAGGLFTAAGGLPALRIAKWNGSSWATLAGGVNAIVWALTTFDDGSGQALYAGGGFTNAGGVVANRIAKWDGSSWAALGSGLGNAVRALTVFDDDSGPALYAGGEFTTAGGVPANFVAKWDGSSWTPVGSGTNGNVVALTTFDDGGGPALYAGGYFTTAGGVAANRIAKWDGASWTPLGSGLNGSVETLTVFNDRTGAALYAGGTFTSAFDSADSFLAKWGCPDTNPPAITCPASIVVDDRRANGTGEVVSFTVTALDEEDPTPSLVCTPPSGSLFLPGTTIVTCTATDFSGNQSTCQFTVTVRAKVREL